jgi:hypothetical protein
MIKLIKKILGIDRLEKAVEYLVNSREGEKNILVVILKTLKITPEKLIELLLVNPHEILNYNEKVSRLIKNKLDKQE